MDISVVHNIAKEKYEDGVTNFNVEAFVDLMQIANKNSIDVKMVQMHPKVFERASKNNLLDYEPDTFLGLPVEEYEMSEDAEVEGVQATYIHLKNDKTLTLLTREY